MINNDDYLTFNKDEKIIFDKMRSALEKEKIKNIYNSAAWYYDLLHSLGTFRLDERGRKFLVSNTVTEGNKVLDCGGGTGLTAMKAAKAAGESGEIVVCDLSLNMLNKGINKTKKSGFDRNIHFHICDMNKLPYKDSSFDVVLSTYSTCPLEDPIIAVREMVRVLKSGGRLGIAHSTYAPTNFTRKISDQIDNLLWKFPSLSLGCRAIEIESGLKGMNVKISESKTIGFVPFYFKLIVAVKN